MPNLANLTYAGIRGDIFNRPLVDSLLTELNERAIVHFAAESLVDRSIHGRGAFIMHTNAIYQFTLVEAAREHWI